MFSGPVAVIDIGSNSIKVLVATRGADGNITPLKIHTLDARISAGISARQPRLSEDGMRRGLEAIRALLADAAPHAPARTVLVATSAVRDANNGAEFRERVFAATGHHIRILSGEEEATFIGRGLMVDPALRDANNFYVFDLGGGSLECLAFRQRRIEQAVSLKLGCVRLTEKFVADPEQPVSKPTTEEIVAYTRASLGGSGFGFSLPADALVVGTGGTVTTARAILGAREGIPFDATDPLVGIGHLRQLLGRLAALTLAERKRISGLPAARADVFPTALATLIGVAEAGEFDAYRTSVYNLRYGLAAELLEQS